MQLHSPKTLGLRGLFTANVTSIGFFISLMKCYIVGVKEIHNLFTQTHLVGNTKFIISP